MDTFFIEIGSKHSYRCLYLKVVVSLLARYMRGCVNLFGLIKFWNRLNYDCIISLEYSLGDSLNDIARKAVENLISK